MIVKTFGDSSNREYAEQSLYSRSATQAGNTSDILNDIMGSYEHDGYTGKGKFDMTSGGDGDCGCSQGSASRKRLSPEYKMLWVVIGIVAAWMLVTWHHHSRIHHMRTQSRS